MKKLVAILVGLIIGSAAFAMPMYAGLSLGGTNYGTGEYRTGGFTMEPRFGIRPIDAYQNIAFEVFWNATLPSKKEFERNQYWNMYYKDNLNVIAVRCVYDFNELSAVPGLSFFADAGLGLGIYGCKFVSESTYYNDTSSMSVYTGFCLPVGGGAKYAFMDNLEAVASMEFGIGSFTYFQFVIGCNYKFY